MKFECTNQYCDKSAVIKIGTLVYECRHCGETYSADDILETIEKKHKADVAKHLTCLKKIESELKESYESFIDNGMQERANEVFYEREGIKKAIILCGVFN